MRLVSVVFSKALVSFSKAAKKGKAACLQVQGDTFGFTRRCKKRALKKACARKYCDVEKSALIAVEPVLAQENFEVGQVEHAVST